MFAMYENRRVSYTATSNWDVWMGVLGGQNTYIVDFFFLVRFDHEEYTVYILLHYTRRTEKKKNELITISIYYIIYDNTFKCRQVIPPCKNIRIIETIVTCTEC